MTGRVYRYYAATMAVVVLLAYAASVWAEAQAAQTTCQTTLLTASDAANADLFGLSAVVQGGRVFIGAPSGDKGNDVINAGSVYLFQRSGIEWVEQAELNASDADQGDDFGASISVSGDLLLVGAPQGERPTSQGDIGVAYVLKRVGQSWTEEAELTAELRLDEQNRAAFGAAVAIDGTRAIVGAPDYNNGGIKSGKVYFFERQPDETWKRVTPSAVPTAGNNDRVGAAVDISGDWAIVGAPQTDELCPLENTCDSGSAFIYMFTGRKWEKQQTLPPPSLSIERGYKFGTSVAIDGDVAVVGAVGAVGGLFNFPFAGAAYVFRRNSNGTPDDLTDDTWVLGATLGDPEGGPDFFGNAVSVSGDTIAVGANLHQSQVGAVYVFRHQAGVWNRVVKLMADDPNVIGFGSSVATDGDYVISGSWATNSSAGTAYTLRISNVEGCSFNECDIHVDFGGPCVGDMYDPTTNPDGCHTDSNANGVPDACECQDDTDCDDNLPCTTDSCDTGTGRCANIADQGQCAIDGACIADTQVNPASECQECNVAVDPYNWSSLPEDTICGEGQKECSTEVCRAGACTTVNFDTTTACGSPSASACDDPDTCDGAGNCSSNTFAQGTVCRAAAGQCDVAEVCDGQSPDCPANEFVASGTPCDDTDPCTCSDAGVCSVVDACDGNGACIGGQNPCPNQRECIPVAGQNDFECLCETDVDCDDGNFCSGTDSCDLNGRCSHSGNPCPAATSGERPVCDPSAAANADDACVECLTPQDCPACPDDGRSCSCTEAPTCSALHVCEYANKAEFTPNCGDDTDTECDNPDTCDAAGHCDPRYEDVTTECNFAGQDSTCDPRDHCDGAGACPPSFAATGTDCSDENFCDGPETCDGAGVCTGTGQNPCPALTNGQRPFCDVNAPEPTPAAACVECLTDADCPVCPGDGRDCTCTKPPTCSSSNVCEYDNEPEGTPHCGDDSATDCNAPDTCDATGHCDARAVNDGGACVDDGNDCTDDICIGGVCTHPVKAQGAECNLNGADTICDPRDICDGAGSCTPVVAAAGTVCSDAFFCDGPEQCDGAGACVETGGDPCRSRGLICEEKTGSETPGEGTCICDTDAQCDDGDFCTGVETCVDGRCVASGDPCLGEPVKSKCDEFANACVECLDGALDCDDGDVCTDDLCPDGECVNEHREGCQDADFDGVQDESDDCPGTPRGAQVDENGCACSQLDDDEDGVSNCDDLCADTPAERRDTVNFFGCSCDQPVNPDDDLDEDDDGVDNCSDLCSATPAGEPVDGSGCSDSQLDDDGDGVPNDDDLCPATPADQIADFQGCSLEQLEVAEQPAPDEDEDGVADQADQCPGTSPSEASDVDALGCGPSQRDSDGDGVMDAADDCPDTPADQVDRVGDDGCVPSTTGGGSGQASRPTGSRGPCGFFGLTIFILMFVGLGAMRWSLRREQRNGAGGRQR
ncbi:MAG: hypothetical protein ACE5HE_07250 [Phycisphaerae bacterium]